MPPRFATFVAVLSLAIAASSGAVCPADAADRHREAPRANSPSGLRADTTPQADLSRYAQRSGATGGSMSPIDLSAVKRALDLIRRGRPDEAAALTRTITQPASAKLIEWAILRSGRNEGKPFERYAAFLRANPHWPSTGLFRRRAEEALWDEAIAPALVRDFFAESKPTSPKGRLALAKASVELGQNDAAQQLVRHAWREDSFSPAVEERVLSEFGDMLTEEDHKVRLARRLYDKDGDAALSVAKRLGPADQALAKAWHAVNSKAANARTLLNAVPPEARKDAGYIFSNIQLLRNENKITPAGQMLLTAPRDPALIHDPDEWWVVRRDTGRVLLEQKDVRTAYRIISEAVTPAKESFRVEHHFLSGWIALRYLNEPEKALAHFAEIARGSENPSAKARAGYWQGRAADAAGRASEARSHYAAGAEFPLVYYGQLAGARLGSPDLPLREPPMPTKVAHDDIVRAVETLYALGERDLVVTIMADIADRTRDLGTLRALAEVTLRNEDPRAMLQLGRDAVEHGMPFDHYAFPAAGVPGYTPIGGEVEPNLVYAIVRQESAFNPRTVSPANALGLMQVTPDTARVVARKFNIAFDQKRLLEDTIYNVQIGAAELGDLVQHFRGSYILAFAAYNAGRGRVNQWIQRYGDPRNAKVDAIDWIERIPFSETRDYVQRVMENVQVYRARLGNGAKLLIESDLRRGVSAN
jgi:soluble lytic murein transglycosylase